jgi:hypothetical protein
MQSCAYVVCLGESSQVVAMALHSGNNAIDRSFSGRDIRLVRVLTRPCERRLVTDGRQKRDTPFSVTNCRSSIGAKLHIELVWRCFAVVP